MNQKEIFKKSEGNNWYKRNSDKNNLNNQHTEEDFIVKLLGQYNCGSKKVLEIGCSNGFRLNELRKKYSIEGYGIEPSLEAITEGSIKYPELVLLQGTADNLTFKDNTFDIVIFGFCLYLCDRKDLFKIAFESDRVLKDNGLLVILDFYPPFAFKNEYSHLKGINSYKLKYDEMFTWNPSYIKVYQQLLNHNMSDDVTNPDDRIGYVVLKKMTTNSYFTSPYKLNKC